MYNAISSTRPASFKFALLSAAIGAGFAMPAQAAYVSAAPAGFTPVVINAATAVSYDLDLDRNGKADFSIVSSTNTNYISVEAATGTTNTIDGNDFISAAAYASTADFISGSAAKNSAGALLDTLTPQAQFAELRFAGINGPTFGYLQGIYTSVNGVGRFTLSDFGSEVTAAGATVPEPGSLALLAAGAAGIGALRRRRNKADRAI